MKIFEGLDKSRFAEEFLKVYLQDGFNTMTKREIDLLILRLLVEHREGWSWDDPPSAFEIAHALRAKRTRLRSMMDELSFRMLTDDDQVRVRLRKIIEDRIRSEGEQIFEDSNVRIQIEDGFLRDYAKNLVQRNYGIVDSSFNSSIIVLSADKFTALVYEVLSASSRDRVEQELAKYRDRLQARDEKNLLKVFVEQAVKGAGAEAGKQAVKFGVFAMTGAWEDLRGAVNWLIEKVKTPNRGDNPAAGSMQI